MQQSRLLEAFAESFTAYVKGEDIPESLKSVVEGAMEKTGKELERASCKGARTLV